MKSLTSLIPLVAGLLIALTYLLVQGMVPDSGRHERTLDDLRAGRVVGRTVLTA